MARTSRVSQAWRRGKHDESQTPAKTSKPGERETGRGLRHPGRVGKRAFPPPPLPCPASFALGVFGASRFRGLSRPVGLGRWSAPSMWTPLHHATGRNGVLMHSATIDRCSFSAAFEATGPIAKDPVQFGTAIAKRFTRPEIAAVLRNRSLSSVPHFALNVLRSMRSKAG